MVACVNDCNLPNDVCGSERICSALYSYFLIIGSSTIQPSLLQSVPCTSVVPYTSSLAGGEKC